MSQGEKKLLPSKSALPAEWYTRLLDLAELTDYGPGRGSVIIRPYGYAIWEQIQYALNSMIAEKGVDNGYFPLLIPLSLIHKEASHIEGFSPELAVVNHAGGEKLEEPLVVRPTSETIMYASYSKWIQSWRDLPLCINQWNNVVRWEKRTTPFLRTTEFLWQEGHTAHSDHAEAAAMQKWAMDVYQKLYREWLAIDGYVGGKSSSERFAGADSTMTFESIMPSGKALQSCTSHDLGQNFSKSFDITFQNKEGNMEYVWQTSWGLSTRSIGALILTHGDDDGLIIPPKIAPIQAVILPVRTDNDLQQYASKIYESLRSTGIRCKIDLREDRIGYKMNKWEVKGVPIIIQVGGKEAQDKTATCIARFDKERRVIDLKNIGDELTVWLQDIQEKMLLRSASTQKAQTRIAKDYAEFKQIMNKHKGFVRVFWNDNPQIEATIKEETKATSRCLIKTHTKPGKDFFTKEPCYTEWLFAQSY